MDPEAAWRPTAVAIYNESLRHGGESRSWCTLQWRQLRNTITPYIRSIGTISAQKNWKPMDYFSQIIFQIYLEEFRKTYRICVYCNINSLPVSLFATRPPKVPSCWSPALTRMKQRLNQLRQWCCWGGFDHPGQLCLMCLGHHLAGRCCQSLKGW